MRHSEHAQRSQYQVITNYEGRYFIWPLEKELPGGWRVEGKTGTRKECLHYLLELWRSRKPKRFQQFQQTIAEQRI